MSKLSPFLETVTENLKTSGATNEEIELVQTELEGSIELQAKACNEMEGYTWNPTTQTCDLDVKPIEEEVDKQEEEKVDKQEEEKVDKQEDVGIETSTGVVEKSIDIQKPGKKFKNQKEKEDYSFDNRVDAIDPEEAFYIQPGDVPRGKNYGVIQMDETEFVNYMMRRFGGLGIVAQEEGYGTNKVSLNGEEVNLGGIWTDIWNQETSYEEKIETVNRVVQEMIVKKQGHVAGPYASQESVDFLNSKNPDYDPDFDLDLYMDANRVNLQIAPITQKGLEKVSFDDLVTFKNNAIQQTMRRFFKTEEGKKAQEEILIERQKQEGRLLASLIIENQEALASGEVTMSDLAEKFASEQQRIIVKIFEENDDVRKVYYNTGLAINNFYGRQFEVKMYEENLGKEFGVLADYDFLVNFVKGVTVTFPSELASYKSVLEGRRMQELYEEIDKPINYDGKEIDLSTYKGTINLSKMDYGARRKFHEPLGSKSEWEGYGIIHKDPKNPQFYTNKEYLKYLEKAKEKSSHLNIVYQKLRGMIREGEVKPNEYYTVDVGRKKGHRVPIHGTYKPLFDGNLFSDEEFTATELNTYRKSYLLFREFKYKEKQIDAIIKADKSGKLTSPNQKFLDNGQFKVDSDNLMEVLGDQAFRLISSIFSVGATSLMAETANVMEQKIQEFVSKKYPNWENFSNEKKADLILQALEGKDGDTQLDLESVFTAGGISGSLDIASNAFLVGKVAKPVIASFPRLFKLLMQQNFKLALKAVGKEGLDVVKTTLLEMMTEGTQELITGYGAKYDNLDGLYTYLGDGGNYENSLNAMVTSMITTPILGGSARTLKSFKKAFTHKLLIRNNPDGILKAVQIQMDKELEYLQNGKDENGNTYTSEMYEERMQYLNGVDLMITKSDMNLKNKDAVLKLLDTYLEQQKKIDEKTKIEEELEELRKEYPGFEKMIQDGTYSGVPGKSDRFDRMQIELAILNDDIDALIKERNKTYLIELYETEGKELASEINNDPNRDTEVIIFDEEDGNKSVESFLSSQEWYYDLPTQKRKEVKDFLEGKENGLAITLEEILEINPDYEGRGILLISNDNARKNIEKGDVYAASVIHHEIDHANFSHEFKGEEGLKRLEAFKNKLEVTLRDSDNIIMQMMYQNIMSRMSTYSKKGVNLNSRVGYEEFLAAFGDIARALKAEGTAINPEFATAFNKIVKEFASILPGEANKWTTGNTLEFLSNFDHANPADATLPIIQKFIDENGNDDMIVLDGAMVSDIEIAGFLPENSYKDINRRSSFADESAYNLMRETVTMIYPGKRGTNEIVAENKNIQQRILNSEKKGIDATRIRDQYLFNNWGVFENIVKNKWRKGEGLDLIPGNRDEFVGRLLEEFIKMTKTYTPDMEVQDKNGVEPGEPGYIKTTMEFGAYLQKFLPARIPDIYDGLNKMFTQSIDPTPDSPGMTNSELNTFQDEEISAAQQIQDFEEYSAIRENLTKVFDFEIDSKNYNSWMASVKEKLGGLDLNMLFDEDASQEVRNLGMSLWKDLRALAQEGGKLNKNAKPTKLYKDFIENTVENFYAQMSIKDLNKFLGDDAKFFIETRERQDTEQSLQKKGRDKPKNKYAGNKETVKLELTEERKEMLLEIMLRTNAIAKFESTGPKTNKELRDKFRIDALIERTLKNYSSILFNDAAMQTMTDSDFKFENGVTDAQIAQMGLLLNKGKDVRFSYAGEELKISLMDIPDRYKTNLKGEHVSAVTEVGKYVVDLYSYFNEVRDIYKKNGYIGEDLEEVIGHIDRLNEKYKMNDATVSFIKMQFDQQKVIDADQADFQNKMNESTVIDEKDKTERSNIRHDTEGKNKMHENGIVLSNKFGKQLLMVTGFEWLGYVNNSRNLQVGKPGSEFQVRFDNMVVDLKEVDYVQQFKEKGFDEETAKLKAEELQTAMKDFRSLNITSGSNQNFTNTSGTNIFQRVAKILEKGYNEDGSIRTKEQKYQELIDSGLIDEIKRANKANRTIHKHIITGIFEEVKAGNLDMKALHEMFKMGSGLVHGFRGFSQMFGFQILDGKQKPTKGPDGKFDWKWKGEHVASISKVNSDIVELIAKAKNDPNIDFEGELDIILAEYGQILGNNKDFDVIDEGGRTNETNAFRINLLEQDNYVDLDNRNMKELQLEVTLEKEMIKNQVKEKRRGEVKEQIRNSLAGGEINGATIADFDETLAFGKNYIIAKLGNKTIKVPSEEFHERVGPLSAQGYEFDFSDFVNVRQGTPAPFMDKFIEKARQFGTTIEGKSIKEDHLKPFLEEGKEYLQASASTYILTARQPEAARAIQAYLLQQGVYMPLENITGLGVTVDGKTKTVTAEDKADWVEENLIFNGVNQLTFADDGLKNVEAMIRLFTDYQEVLDLPKSRVYQIFEDYYKDLLNPLTGDQTLLTKTELENFKNRNKTEERFSLKNEDGEFFDFIELNDDGTPNLEKTINVIIEQSTGIERYKTYSEAEGKIRGAKMKSLWDVVRAPSMYDLELFTYRMLADGELGEQQQKFFEEKLFKPYNDAYVAMSQERRRLNNGVNKIIEELGKEKHGNLKTLVEGTNYSYEQAVRVYLWSRNGMEIPGLTSETQAKLVEAVEQDKDIENFAKKLGMLSQAPDGYMKPTDYWMVEGIDSDLRSLTKGEGRASFLKVWQENVDQIFSPEVRNKLRDAYGNNYVEALDNMLDRMKTGENKRTQGRLETAWSNWVNGSVGATMFLNMRSATLQLISAFNYIDFGDNNVIAAGKRLADVPQFAKDFLMIWNSDYLVGRREGEEYGVNEAQLIELLNSGNPAQSVMAYLMKLGFTPTRIADSFAIASGGAAYYRNKVMAYEKQGMTTEEAESKAFSEFIEQTEKAQQSYRPDKVSEQQASNLGRVIQAFANTPMQYNRIMLKAISDMRAGRGNAKENLMKVAYYGVVQNGIFVALQQALWAKFGEDEDEWTEATERARDSMIDNLLTGMGFSGQILRTAKNGYLEWKDQRKKGYNADHAYTILQFANLSPTIGIKLRKLYGAIVGEQINQEVIEKMGWTIHNPALNAMAQLVSAVTNVPTDRAVQKVQNILIASKNETEVKDKIALLMGWNPWDLNLETEAKEVRADIKEEKKLIKEETKEEEAVKEIQDDVNEEIQKQKEQKEKGEKVTAVKCAHVNSDNKRCGMNVDKAGDKCHYHTDKKGTIKQCKHIKSNGNRCKEKTTNKSGRCLYHADS